MKKRHYSLLCGALLTAGLIITLTRKSPLGSESPTAALPKDASSPAATKPVEKQPSAETLATTGTLWEPGGTASDAKRTSIPIEADSFVAATAAATGDKLTFHLSNRIKPLTGTVTFSDTQEDGTLVVRVQLDGTPAGELVIQENKEADFFLGQLYYQDLPLAYEFKETHGGLIASRRLVSDLICSSVNNDSTVEMGLPLPGALPEAAKTTPNTTTTGSVTMSLSNGTVPEGNTGAKSVLFALNLSSKLKKAATFTYTVTGVTATEGVDFIATSGSVSTARTAVISIPIKTDTEAESDETFTVTVTNATYGTVSATGTIANDDGIVSSSVPILNSLPEATATAYLDFDGQSVPGGIWSIAPINAAAANVTPAQVTEIWKRVAEDYAPFQINITTDAAVYAAAAPINRIRCIITPTSTWYGYVGGVAYLGSFTWTGDTPCWVFSNMLSNSPRYMAEATSHEIGHTLGLSHDGTAISTYYTGQGTGNTSWAPIMGTGYDRNLVQWSKGEYNGAKNKEDDVAIIVAQNGFTYKVDDHGNTTDTATALTGTDPTATGVITTRDDVDNFSFTTTGGKVTFAVTGATPSGNLDIQARIVNSSGTTLATANPTGALNATVTATLGEGTYYLVIDGVGEGVITKVGYSDYGSIGAYTITGTVP